MSQHLEFLVRQGLINQRSICLHGLPARGGVVLWPEPSGPDRDRRIFSDQQSDLRWDMSRRPSRHCYELSVRGFLGPTLITALTGLSGASVRRSNS
jgi:hypothetical protein